MQKGDKVKSRYVKDADNNPLIGTVVQVIDYDINPYNIMVKWEGTARHPWSNFPIGNYKENHLEKISA